MFADPSGTVVRKRLGFFSVAVISLAMVTISLIVCGSGITLYGMRLVDKKSDSIVGLLGDAAAKLPEFRKALPPAIADAIDDERLPAYAENLKVTVRQVQSNERRNSSPASIEVENTGDKVVSLLGLRIVGLDATGAAVWERGTYAATPLQIDNDWRGPLLPHETRRLTVGWHYGEAAEKLTYEITDVRVWRGASGVETKPSPAPLTSPEARPEA